MEARGYWPIPAVSNLRWKLSAGCTSAETCTSAGLPFADQCVGPVCLWFFSFTPVSSSPTGKLNTTITGGTPASATEPYPDTLPPAPTATPTLTDDGSIHGVQSSPQPATSSEQSSRRRRSS